MSHIQTPRMAISPDALRAILQSEFRRRRSAICPTCTVPLPLFREPSGSGSANWTIPPLAACANHCADVLSGVAGELFLKFDIKHEGRQR